jgi:2Fe-2S ferredoxin
MPTIVFIEHNGKSHTVSAEIGESVMEAAVNNLVPGITADCGGSCACATCHVYVEEAWMGHTIPPGESEREMIGFAMDVKESSRLGCQIKITTELDGLVVHLPEFQI